MALWPLPSCPIWVQMARRQECSALQQICEYHANRTIAEETLRQWAEEGLTQSLVKVGMLAKEHCSQDKMEKFAGRLCQGELRTASEKLACVKANRGAISAEACVHDAVHLGALCANVCYHESRLKDTLRSWGMLGTSLLMLLVLVRCVKIFQQCFASFSSHFSTATSVSTFGRELGCVDNFDTESE